MSNKNRRWSKSMEKDGDHKRAEVREIDNGYLVTITISEQKEDGEMEIKEKEYFSKENPLEGEKGKEKQTKEEKSVEDLGKALLGMDIGDLL